MGLHPQNIGASMPNGFAGSYAQQPDMIVNTRPLGGNVPVVFGTAMKYGTGAEAGKVIPMGAGATAVQFVGVAAREIKTSLEYLTQGPGQYAPNEAVPTFARGVVNVVCQKGAPALGGPVYVRIAVNAAAPTAVVGGFEAEADGANTVQLTNCQWSGAADSNKVAALRILTMINA